MPKTKEGHEGAQGAHHREKTHEVRVLARLAFTSEDPRGSTAYRISIDLDIDNGEVIRIFRVLRENGFVQDVEAISATKRELMKNTSTVGITPRPVKLTDKGAKEFCARAQKWLSNWAGYAQEVQNGKQRICNC